MLLISELLSSEEGLDTSGEVDRISVKVLSNARSTRVEIKDQGTGVVLGGLRRYPGLGSAEWGPHLLSRISDRWGLVSDAEGGAWVWFELDLPRGGN